MRVGVAAGAVTLAVGALACDSPQSPAGAPGAASASATIEASTNALAARYVRLVLAVGQHDADYVDAYYGPPDWRPTDAARSLTVLDAEAEGLQQELLRVAPPETADEMVRLRHRYLSRQLTAVRARIGMLTGSRFSFDEESRLLYDAVAPVYPESHFGAALQELERLLPGPGPLVERYTRYRERFAVRRHRLDATFRAAIEACRAKTLAHVTLPPGETFTVEYVTGKSWSGYNWYQGGFRSLIQVNTDLPVLVDRAVDLACHEGYPGHHVYNALLEQHLVRERGWIEFSVYPLFSPQSLIAEGTANYGIAVAFSPAERLQLEEQVIFPAAGLNSAEAAHYYSVMRVVDQLSYAGNEAARRYLNGEIDRVAAASILAKWGLYSSARAEQRVRFIDQYRSYVINYNLGKDLVAGYVERVAGGTVATRWRAFAALLSSPRLPSNLTEPR